LNDIVDNLHALGFRASREQIHALLAQLTASHALAAVINEVKYPEKIRGKGAGDFVSGMCIYPMPATGRCDTLGTGCEPVGAPPQSECRCSAAPGVDVPAGPAQDQAAF
jgi:hypothetical protein